MRSPKPSRETSDLCSPLPTSTWFYRNFERALRMVPIEAELVAHSDHDDRWYPDKLEVLREAIGSGELAYSDVRRVDASGTYPQKRCGRAAATVSPISRRC
jgi:hypothetical protein